ncbi:MAG: hypothetical protein CUN55_10195 [Phototrophicales bacterium]|nr:MAG: hypothetical protein CUN55_10195 [Phototrophicales bacterium]
MIEITNNGKYALTLRNPVMIASGMMGFDPHLYRNLIKLEKLGAVITAGITYKPRKPANGPRVVPVTGGMLLHTGLPNSGINRVLAQYQNIWARSPIPVIPHIVANQPNDVARIAERLEGLPNVVAIELGLHDQAQAEDIQALIHAARQGSQLPLLVKLPLFNAIHLAEVAAEFGADALVIAGPPRGTERDPISGKLVGGRLYGTYLKAQTLRVVGFLAGYLQTPIIACGGIHSSTDARDYLEAGARAVQIDTLVWVNPAEVEVIARHIGGEELTRAIGALPDEWHPGLGKTQLMQRKKPASSQSTVPPPNLPELPLDRDDPTMPSPSQD